MVMLGGLAWMVGASLLFGEWDKWRLPIIALAMLTSIVLAAVAVARLFLDD